jgi:dethiobiotin synthetase
MRPKVIYISGFRQHAGKTITSLGLISLLRKIYAPEDIGYIKPVGQELFTLANGIKTDKDTKILQNFLLPDLDMSLASPVKIPSGVTKTFLTSKHREQITKNYIKDIKHAIDSISDKKIIIAEGTGHPGVGSIVGLSNADVCKILDAEIIYLAGGGLGKSIDMLTTDLTFFAAKGVQVRGIIFNKIFPHKLEIMRKYISEDFLNMMYKGYFKKPIKILGFLPEIEYLNKPSMRQIMKKFPDAIPIGDPLTKDWETPCGNIKIISVPEELFHPEEYLQSRDVIIISAGSANRLSRIIDYNKRLKSKLAGIILSCTRTSELDNEKLEKIQSQGIPAFSVSMDTAKTDDILHKCIDTTKIQPYDSDKIFQVFDLFDKYYDFDKFREVFDV